MSDKVTCPECGEQYDGVGCHWRYHPSHRPLLSDYQIDVITGLMLGDGHLCCSNKNPYLKVEMINEEYIKLLDSIFGIFSTGASLSITAKESAEKSRKSGLNSDARVENHSDVWKVATRTHPQIHKFDWYTGDEGKKVWPKDIELTPTVLTHWYVGDGSWDNHTSHNYIIISTMDESENRNKIDSYFESSNLPTPSNYCENGNGVNIQFTVDQTKELFEYMDPAPLGFEYKFPEKYHDPSFYNRRV